MTTTHTTPQPIAKLLVETLIPLRVFSRPVQLFEDDEDRPTLRVMLVRDLHREMLGPGHRKRTAMFDTDSARGVARELRLRGLALYTPRANAALQDAFDAGQLGRPLPGERQHSIYSMLPAGYPVAVVDEHSAFGARILASHVEMIDDPAATEVVRVAPTAEKRIQWASVLDAVAIFRLIERGEQ